MFPHLYEEVKDLGPSVFFGGQEPPTYHQIPISPNASIQQIVQTIYDFARNKNACGFVTDEAINYFIDEQGSIYIDSSKKFIFFG